MSAEQLSVKQKLGIGLLTVPPVLAITLTLFVVLWELSTMLK